MSDIEKTLAEVAEAHREDYDIDCGTHDGCACDAVAPDDERERRSWWVAHLAAEQAKALAALPAPRVLDWEAVAEAICSTHPTIHGKGYCFRGSEGAVAVLALQGRTESQIKAEALREAARKAQWAGWTPDRTLVTTDWLNARADALDPKETPESPDRCGDDDCTEEHGNG